MFDLPGPVIIENAVTEDRDVFGVLLLEPLFVKASDLAPNERWITLKSPNKHGGESEGGVHVKIRVGSDGSGHVISGPGELRGLRLTRLASPEELKERRSKRDAERKEAKQKEAEDKARADQADIERAASDPAAAQEIAQKKLGEQQAQLEKQGRKEDLEGRMTEMRAKLLEHAATLTGDDAYLSDRAQASVDPATYEDYKAGLKDEALGAYHAGVNATGETEVRGDEERAAQGAGSVIASRNVRQIKSGLSALRKHLVQNLIQDPELKSAVLGESEDAVDPAALESGKPSSSPGYRRMSGAQAARQGFTAGDARAESEDVFRNRVNQIALGNPKRAQAIVKMRQMTRDRAAAERKVKETATGDQALSTPAPARKVAPDEIKKKAEQVREFLKTHDELQALEREYRAVTLDQDPKASPEEKQALMGLDKPLPSGAEWGMAPGEVDAAFAAKLESEIHDAAKQDLTRAFLDTIEEDPQHSGYAQDVIRKAMMQHVGVGAHAHLANAALSALGHEGLDRQVVDTLGVEAAAQLVAHALRRDAPERLDELRKGLSNYHDEHSLTAMQEAMDLANAARADAAEIDLPPITSTTDAAAVMQLNKERKARISEAHEALGVALGAVEAGAALNMALSGSGKNVLVRFGNAPAADVATNLRALGLEDGDYRLERSTEADGTLTASITPAGMDRLTPPLDARRQHDAQVMAEIKGGHRDEADYLPAGFEARPADSFNAAPEMPRSFALPLDTSNGLEAGIDDMIASRYADGWAPSEIYAHLRDDVAPDLTPEQSEALFTHLRERLPITKEVQKTDHNGETYTAHEAQDIDALPEVQARLETAAGRLLAERFPGEHAFHHQHLEDNAHTREAVFRALAADPTLSAAFSPPSELGGDRQGRARVRAIKKYAERHLLSQAPLPELGQEAQAELQKLDERYTGETGELPDKWGTDNTGGFDLFGGGGGSVDGPVVLKLHSGVEAARKQFGDQYTPEQESADHQNQTATQTRALARYGLQNHEDYTLSPDGTTATLTDSGRQRLTLPPSSPTYGSEAGAPEVVKGGLEGLNPRWVEYQQRRNMILENDGHGQDTAEAGARTWAEFAEAMGGPRRAYHAVQEKMQSDFLERFHGHYGEVTGQGLKLSKVRTESGERLLGTLNPGKLRELRAERARTVARVRQRAGGKFAAEGQGGATARADQAERDAAAAKLQQGSLFGASAFSPDAASGGEVQASAPRHLSVAEDERYALGRAAEGRLRQMVRHVHLGVEPGDNPVSLIKNMGWGAGGKHVGKQRGVKALLETGRLLGFYGAGSGKTAMQIGGFTQAHAEGKAKKALLVCPSIVRNQFGEEASKFTTPGKYSWHSRDDSYEGRKGAYTGDTHMVVVTHATFRDDMVRLMAEHQGVSPEAWGARFEAMPRPQRAAALKGAMEHHGIPLDYLAIDEAHDFLNRAGKQDSLMSAVAEAAMDSVKYKSLWTGSPVKNDTSEIHDWLAKVDPERFSDRDTFMRRYGVNTVASREALQRLMDSYSYVDSTRPDIQRTVTWGARDEQGNAAPLKLTPQQDRAYQDVLGAFARASRARRAGRVDVEACKVLSPRSFEGASPAEYGQIAEGLTGALGTLKHAALGRVVNEYPAEHNAKVQHVLQLASQAKDQGQGGVIFARNRASVAMLKEELEKAGHKVGVIDGSTTTDGKGQVRQAFDRGDVDIVIASDAGATGANLQKRGEWLVNYDLPLTQKTLEQRNARIDRLGQKKHVQLHHLETATAYDADNRKRLKTKAELGDILQGEFKSLDDQGLAGYLLRARAERGGDPMPSWDEDLAAPAISENAKPAARGPDVPDELPSVPGQGRGEGSTARA